MSTGSDTFSQNGLSEKLKGELLIFLAVILGSLIFVIVNPGAIHLHPIWIAACSTLCALIPVSFLMFHRKLWYQLKNRTGVIHAFKAGIITGTIYYILIHWGSYHTSPQNAAIIASFEMFGSMLLLRKKSHERLTKSELIGALSLLSAIGLIFIPSRTQPGLGDLVLLSAGFVSPLGNWNMKLARLKISSVTVMWIRSVVGATMLFCIGVLFTDIPSSSEIQAASFAFLVNGILVLGISKLFWVEGIHRIPITKACALASTGPIFTFLFAWLVLAKLPNIYQLIALPPAMFGIYFIMKKRETNKPT